MVTYTQLIDGLNNHKTRSAWSRGVKDYALGLMKDYDWEYDGIKMTDDVPEPRILKQKLLNGADDWKQYSWGGCGLIYDEDIALKLCNPSELKKVRKLNKWGYLEYRRPNAHEEWLDVQARALYQAFMLIEDTYHELNEAAV